MSESEKKVEYSKEFKETIRERNLEYTGSICKALAKPSPELIANVVTMNYTMFAEELVNSKSEYITNKTEGHCLDPDIRIPNLSAATVDNFKTRVSLTAHGCSVIMDNRIWVTLSEDEFKQAVDIAQSKMSFRLDSNYDDWLLPALKDDREAVVKTAASVMTYGSKNKIGDLTAVVELMNRFGGVVNTVLPGSDGARDVNYSGSVAVSVETVVHGNTARLLVRSVVNINAPYIVKIED